MTQAETIRNLKFTITSLQSKLSDAEKQIDLYKNIQTQADNKIKTMTKLQNQKVKSLLNSIQILKKQKASVQNLTKQHKRSKLIQQLNKQILDQDIVIETMRKYVYQDKGKQQGRKILDELIIKTLTKGPERIRPETRQELRMQIQKLKSQLIDKKVKNIEGKSMKQLNDQDKSEISSVSDRSFVNKNEQIYQKMRQLQSENEHIKIQLASQNKIIQKIKGEIKQKQKYRGQLELTVNQLQVANRKIFTYQNLLRQNRQNVNKKIAELYQRQLKVQELQLNNKQNGERLNQANQTHNIMISELQQEKQQLTVQIQRLKKQNQFIMIENITLKKRQDQQKNKILQIRDLNSKAKDDLGQKIALYQRQTRRLIEQNQKLRQQANQAKSQLFKQKGDWLQQKSNLLDQLKKYETLQSQAKLDAATQQQIQKLRKQNRDLKQLLQSGSSGNNSDNKVLLERLNQLQKMLQFYKTQDKSKERQLYEQLYLKYSNLLQELQNLKKNGIQTKKNKVKQIDITKQEKDKLSDFSSGISRLGLEDIDSAILDNFDSSYEYQLNINEFQGKKYENYPKLTQQDKQLLKLINSDLWQFVKDDKVGNKIQQYINSQQKIHEAEQQQLQRRIKAIKNISNPRGKKIQLYQPQVKEIDSLSDNVSVTSAIQKQIDKYDSDIDVSIIKAPKGTPVVNFKKLQTLSDNCSSEIDVSVVKSGDSSLMGKVKKQKASGLKVDLSKSLSGSQMNSSVSSHGINQSALAGMDSDVSIDFRKKKIKK